MGNFFETLESTAETDGAFIGSFETAMGSRIAYVRVCDDVTFAMSEEVRLTVV